MATKKEEEKKVPNLVEAWDNFIKAQASSTSQEPAPKVNPPRGTVETFSNREGAASGVTLPDGRTFLGLSPEDVNQIAQAEAEKTARPVNSAVAGTAQQKANVQAQNAQLIEQAKKGLMTSQELQGVQGAKTDYGQAVGAGVVGAAPGILSGSGLGGLGTGAVVGGAIGSVVPVMGTAIGAVAGGVIGAAVGSFIRGLKGNIAQQQAEEFTRDQSALSKGTATLRLLTADIKANPQNAHKIDSLEPC